MSNTIDQTDKVTISTDHYQELVSKANLLDFLSEEAFKGDTHFVLYKLKKEYENNGQ